MAQRLALIIGNSLYLDGTLSHLLTPDADVGALGELLLDPEIGGFDDVKVMVNMSSHIIRRSIASFYAKKGREDLLLLYFSGHGVLDDQGNLFLAVRDTDSKLLSGTAISAGYITNEMNNSYSQRQVLVLDCCHSGAFARGSKGQAGASVGTATAFEGTGYGRVVLTASDATQYAWEGDRIIGRADNSLFTHYMLEGIKTGKADRDQDGQITVDELYDYVYEQVVRQTPQQTPGKWSYKERGEIVLSKVPQILFQGGPRARIPDLEQDQEQKLEQLYNEGLSAYWLEEWDKAVRCFEAILELRGDYLDTTKKLTMSKQNKRLVALYNQALAAESAREWEQVIPRLEELLSLVPAYKDASQRLEMAQRAKQLADLYQEARQLSQAGKWPAVVNIFARISSLQPDYPDPDELLATAQQEVAEIERLEHLQDLYNRALREMDAGDWQAAQALLVQVQEIESGYKGADRLLEKVESEINRQQVEQQRSQQINSLYEQALVLADARQWSQVLEKLQAIKALDENFPDSQDLEAKAQTEIERQQAETQRQIDHAARYAEAVQFLEAGKYQEALEGWAQVQALDPAYPDRQKVQATAKKKLKEITQVSKPKRRVPRWALYAFGLGILLIFTLVGFFNHWWLPAAPPGRDVQISDFFDTPVYNGSYNYSIWDARKSETFFTIKQKNGQMTLSAAGIAPEPDTKESMIQLKASQGLPLNTTYYLETKLMMGAEAYMAHLGVIFALPGGYAECQIQAQSEDRICCFISDDQDIRLLPCARIIPGSWHKIGIELSYLNPVVFNFSIDDQQHGTLTLNNLVNPQEISTIAIHLLSYSEEVNWGFVDNVKFGRLK